MKEAILGNPKTSIIGVCAIGVMILMWTHTITFEQSLSLLGAIVAALGLASKQVDKGSSITTPEADRVIASVQKAEKQGIIETAPKDSKPSDAKE